MLTLNGIPTRTFGDIIVEGDIVGPGDVMYPNKSVIKTIGIAGNGMDFTLTSVANNTEQQLDLGAIIPAFATVLDCQLRCFETVAGSGSAVMTIDVGISTGNDDLLFAAAVDSVNDVRVPDIAAAPLILPAITAQSVWVNFTPTANWDTLTAGRWAIIVAYIDLAAAFAQRNP